MPVTSADTRSTLYLLTCGDYSRFVSEVEDGESGLKGGDCMKTVLIIKAAIIAVIAALKIILLFL